MITVPSDNMADCFWCLLQWAAEPGFTAFPMMPLPSNYWLGWVGIKRDYTAGIDSTGSRGVLFWQSSHPSRFSYPHRQGIIILVFSRWKTVSALGDIVLNGCKLKISHLIKLGVCTLWFQPSHFFEDTFSSRAEFGTRPRWDVATCLCSRYRATFWQQFW